MGALEQEVRLRAWQFARGEIGRDEFMDWFAPIVMTEIDEASEAGLRELVGDIAHFDADFTSGAGTEADLREGIRQRLHVYRLELIEGGAPAVQVRTASSNVSSPAGVSALAVG